MKNLLVIFSVCFTLSLRAQPLTIAQAITYAQKLHQSEILSKKGERRLIKQITTNQLKQYWQVPERNNNATQLSSSAILTFCASAFESESRSLAVTALQSRIIDTFNKKNYRAYRKGKPSPSRGKDFVQREFERRRKATRAYHLEEKIPAEDALPDTLNWIGHYFYSSSGYGLQSPGFIHPHRSALGKTGNRTMQDLLRIGLIDERVYREVLAGIRSYRIFGEENLVGYAAQRVAYYENFEVNKKKELALLDALTYVEVLSDESHRQLPSSYQEYELKGDFGLLPYCQRALVMEQADYPSLPSQYYQKVFQQIKQLLPDFDYRNLRVTFSNENWFEGLYIEQQSTLTFEAGGKEYANRFFYNSISQGFENQRQPDTLARISRDFHQGINKWLADRNSEQRLYLLTYADEVEEGSDYGQKKFGLILLTKMQYTAWHRNGSGKLLTEQCHDNTFNTENIERIIQQYEQLGLFAHLTAGEKSNARRKVSESIINSYQDILACFPKTFVDDLKHFPGTESPYLALFQAFSNTTRGALEPANAKDNYQPEKQQQKISFGFEVRGHPYQQTIRTHQVDKLEQVAELIKEALKNEKVDGDLYHCPNKGYIFLTTSQYEYLKQEQPSLFFVHSYTKDSTW